MRRDVIISTEFSITELAVESSATNVIPEGNVVIATRVGLGKVCIVGQDTAINQDLRGIIPRSRDVLDVRFLFWWLKSVAHLIEHEGTGATVQGVRLPFIKSLEIPVPPLDEQHRIVDVLDEAFEGIATARANAEKNLQNADLLFARHLQAVFENHNKDWVRRKLGDLSVVQSGGTPRVSNVAYWGGEVPWYSSGELNAYYTVTPERQITNAGLSNSNAKLFPKGSLLIGMYDTAALKMSILDRDAAFNQAIAGVKPNCSLDLGFVLHSINARKPMILSQRRGVRQKNLSLAKVKDIDVSLPPLSEQQAIVSSLAKIAGESNRLESLYHCKLAALGELKQSLLHQAFTGQLSERTLLETGVP